MVRKHPIATKVIWVGIGHGNCFLVAVFVKGLFKSAIGFVWGSDK
jgi:hypothetical protein